MRIKNKVPVVMGKASFRGVATAECFRTAEQKQPEGTSHRHPNTGFLHVQDKNWEMYSYQMLKQRGIMQQSQGDCLNSCSHRAWS